MRPEVDAILSSLAQRQLVELAPQLGGAYAQGTATLMALLMRLAAEEFENAAAIRAAENADFRALFLEIAPGVAGPRLRAKLKAAAGDKDTSLKISALNAANEHLRRLLIAAHAHVETRPGAPAREAERAILAALKRSADRRFVAPLAV